ncbi:hypothetical protein C8J57DRAFT_1256291 [Mycena rebaudengoi]|nr:hypothetical protein C8J57DRAFT_1256291 [Mycena rebaudengoi]
MTPAPTINCGRRTLQPVRNRRTGGGGKTCYIENAKSTAQIFRRRSHEAPRHIDFYRHSDLEKVPGLTKVHIYQIKGGSTLFKAISNPISTSTTDILDSRLYIVLRGPFARDVLHALPPASGRGSLFPVVLSSRTTCFVFLADPSNYLFVQRPNITMSTPSPHSVLNAVKESGPGKSSTNNHGESSLDSGAIKIFERMVDCGFPMTVGLV